MRYHLSFATIDVLEDNIAEVIVNEGVVMTLEMLQEYDNFLIEHFQQPFGLLVNRVNNYLFTFEAKLQINSVEHLKAVAIITYNDLGQEAVDNLMQIRAHDNLNLVSFNAMKLGRENALTWLKQQLSIIAEPSS